MANQMLSIPKVTASEGGEEDIIAQYQKKLRDQDKANMVGHRKILEVLIPLYHIRSTRYASVYLNKTYSQNQPDQIYRD
jgi:hypothetical protein